MRIEQKNSVLDNQKLEKNKKNNSEEQKSPEMSRRKFLRIGMASTLGVAISYQGAKSSFWQKVFDSAEKSFNKLSERKEAILKKKKEAEDKSAAGVEEFQEKKQEEIQELQEGSSLEKREKEKLPDLYLQAYLELSKKEDYFPSDLFPEDLLIAQQFQESKYEKIAKSHANAVGVMQVTPIALTDVCGRKTIDFEKQKSPEEENVKKAKVKKIKEEREGYLSRLRKKGIIETEVPKSLTETEIQEMMKHMKDADYCRAIGKIYLMQLWDNEDGYGVGRSYYQRGDVKKAQEEILASYNAGASRIVGKDMSNWLDEPRDYVQKIRKYEKMIKEIRVASRNNINNNQILGILKKTYFEKDKIKRESIVRSELAMI